MTARPYTHTRSTITLLALTITAGCAPWDDRSEVLAAAEQEVLRTVEARVDSVESVLAEQPGLIAATSRELRRYLNPQQVATARKLGIDPISDSTAVAPLTAQGALVRLEDSTEHWVLRDLTHSLPYVTPDTRAMLTELGASFHEQLDSLGLPPFRFEVTSVLRTAAMQAELRQGNANASRTTSSHEFGTTVDIAYTNFSAPADLDPFVTPPPDTLSLDESERNAVVERARQHAAERLSQLGEDRAAELKGILGDVLHAMQKESKVQPLMERSQPIYHMTVAQRYPTTPARETEGPGSATITE